MRECSRRHYLRNKKALNARSAEYARRHPEERRAGVRRWAAKNPGAVREATRAWREKNPLAGRRYHQANKAKIAARLRARRKESVALRLRNSASRRIRGALQGVGVKSASTVALLGCSVEFLRIHIESLFQPGMSWEIFGRIHVDHIRPCASFNLADPAQQRACFHYTNLQPLWAVDNIRKSDKWLTPATSSVTSPPTD